MCRYVQSHTRASVKTLCEKFDVSESTVRRDLTELERKRLIKRTHGGAVTLDAVGSEPTYLEKKDCYLEEKRSIAACAAGLIEEGDSVLIDSGTTTLCMAPALARFRKLTVVTNSIHLAAQLSGCTGISLILVGGLLRPNTMALVGPVAEETLSRIRVDKAFIALNGIDSEMGLTTPNLLEASVKAKMMEVAEQVYVLADHTKAGRVTFAKFGAAAEIDGLVTSRLIPEEQRQRLEQKNVQIYLADAPEEPEDPGASPAPPSKP